MGTNTPVREPTYWLRDRGTTYGPVPLSTIEEWARLRRLSPEAAMAREGTREWVSVLAQLSLHAQRAAPPTPVRAPEPQSTEPRKSWLTPAAMVSIGAIALLLIGSTVWGGWLVVNMMRQMGEAVSTASMASQRHSDEMIVNQACDQYMNDTGGWPASFDSLARDPGVPGWRGPYLLGEMRDPYSGKPYEIKDGRVVGPAPPADAPAPYTPGLVPMDPSQGGPEWQDASP